MSLSPAFRLEITTPFWHWFGGMVVKLWETFLMCIEEICFLCEPLGHRKQTALEEALISEVTCKNSYGYFPPQFAYSCVMWCWAPLNQRWNLFLYLLNLELALCLVLARGTSANLCTMTCPLAIFENLHLPLCAGWWDPIACQMLRPMPQLHSPPLQILSHLPDTWVSHWLKACRGQQKNQPADPSSTADSQNSEITARLLF